MQRNRLLKWCTSILEEPHHGEKVRKFVCSECYAEYGVIDKIQKNHKEYTRCPKCKKNTLDTYILGAADIQIRGNITTVGQLAEANTKKLGRYGREEKDRQYQESNKTARKALNMPDKEKVERINKINKMTPAEKQKYIHTGEGL